MSFHGGKSSIQSLSATPKGRWNSKNGPVFLPRGHFAQYFAVGLPAKTPEAHPQVLLRHIWARVLLKAAVSCQGGGKVRSGSPADATLMISHRAATEENE